MAKDKPNARKRGGSRARSTLPKDLDLAEATRFCLQAARYHVSGVEHYRRLMEIAGSPEGKGEEAVLRNQAHFNTLNYHVRAYLWEMVAAFDTLLQHLNRLLELGIGERDVDWSTVSLELKNTKSYRKLLRYLAKQFDSQWFKDVRHLRNASHSGPFVAETVWFSTDPPEESRLRGVRPKNVFGLTLLTASGHGLLANPEGMNALCDRMAELIEWAIAEAASLSKLG